MKVYVVNSIQMKDKPKEGEQDPLGSAVGVFQTVEKAQAWIDDVWGVYVHKHNVYYTIREYELQ